MLLVAAIILFAQNDSAFAIEQAATSQNSKQVRHSINHAWDISWSRFYRSDTHLFYDYLTSYEDGQELQHLPTVEEVQRQYPNECGYGTGMEDGMISAGVVLSMIVDRYSVTRAEVLKNKARDVFRAIQLCTTDDGFLARAVCHQDLKTIYPNSSRDQYTHAVHALWEYANSPLCDGPVKSEVAAVVTAIADRMKRNVVAANDYDSLRADGTRDTRGISRMWKVKGHEAARLPMIYAAAWDITKNPEYHALWRKYISEAVAQSRNVETGQPTYAFLQMQISLDLLQQLETDPSLKQTMLDVLAAISERCADRAIAAEKRAGQLDLTRLCTDWRSGEGISSKGTYRTIWYCIRESGEAALSQLVAHNALTNRQQQILDKSITRLDYDRVSSNGILFLQAAYWKDLRFQSQ